MGSLRRYASMIERVQLTAPTVRPRDIATLEDFEKLWRQGEIEADPQLASRMPVPTPSVR